MNLQRRRTELAEQVPSPWTTQNHKSGIPIRPNLKIKDLTLTTGCLCFVHNMLERVMSL